MLTSCYESSISSATTTTLWINMMINVYNLAIIWCNNNSATQVLLGESYEAKQYIIGIETSLTLCVIMHSTIISSLIIFSIKFWILGVTFVFLSVDMMLTCTRFIDLILRSHLDEFWKIRANHRGWDSVSAPSNLYLLVAIILIVYFVFKLYATYTILFIGKTLLYEVSGDGYLLHDEDIERNSSRDQSISTTPPPPTYDQSVMELSSSCSSSSPPLAPPPYSEVQKY